MNKLAPLLLLLISCTTARPPAHDDVSNILDAWHNAAAKADENTYLGLMSDDSVFLGTDSTERWTKPQFLAFVHPYFSAGRGWRYVPRDRHLYFSEDGALAWFEEKLDSESYGELRGTGVLRRAHGEWRIVHYSMSFPIPNDATASVVDLIRKSSP